VCFVFYGCLVTKQQNKMEKNENKKCALMKHDIFEKNVKKNVCVEWFDW